MVSSHVGRTKEQCILQFIRLPIEDPFLEDNLSRSQSAKSKRNFKNFLKEFSLKFPIVDFTPFEESDNPVMGIIAFLSSVVNKEVAAAAAKSALDVYIKQRQEKTGIVPPNSSENSVENSSKDEMETDGKLSKFFHFFLIF